MAKPFPPPPRENVLIEQGQQRTVQPGKPAIVWSDWFSSVYNWLTGVFVTTGGRVKNITVVNSDTTLTEDNHVVKVDTDSGDVTITMPDGVDGTEYWVFNVGTSGNKVILTGTGYLENIYDAEDLELIYDTVEGWD